MLPSRPMAMVSMGKPNNTPSQGTATSSTRQRRLPYSTSSVTATPALRSPASGRKSCRSTPAPPSVMSRTRIRNTVRSSEATALARRPSRSNEAASEPSMRACRCSGVVGGSPEENTGSRMVMPRRSASLNWIRRNGADITGRSISSDCSSAVRLAGWLAMSSPRMRSLPRTGAIIRVT